MAERAVHVDIRMLIATWPADARRGAVTEFCRTHGISRSQFYEIRRIAQEHSPLEAVAPARAPRQRPDLAVAPGMVEAAIRVRKELAGQGWDHGPISVRHRLLEMGLQAPSRASLARIFTAAGMVTPQPQKRPRSSWRRFTFAFVHECWQLDATEWRLGDGQEVTIFQLLDDHSRFIVGSWVDTGETSAAAVAVLRAAVEAHQPPQLLLTDNGRAMNQQRLGRVTTLVAYAATLGTRAITSSPYHPQTMGKNERVHQTLKRWLNAQTPAASIAELTAQVMVFDEHYNHRRPHQALEMATPAHVLTTRQRALPPEPPAPALPPTKRRRGRPAQPLRTVKVLRNGSAPVGRYFIGLGVEYAGTRVIAMIDDTTIAVFDSRGTHLRTVTVNPDQRFYGTGRPRGGKRRHPAQ